MTLANVAAERAVLSGLCAHGADAYFDVCDMLQADTFTLDINQALYTCLAHHFGGSDSAESRQVDFPTLYSTAASLGLRELLEGPENARHVRAVLNMGPTVQRDSVPPQAATIRKLQIGRMGKAFLADVGRDLEGLTGTESIEDIVSRIESPVLDFTSLLHGDSQEGDARLLGENAEAYYQHLMDNPRERVGISTGFPQYDEFLGGGIRPNSTDVIVARAKAGKTTLVDNISLQIAGVQQVPVLNVDLEMSEEEHLHRVGAILAGLPTRDIERGLKGYDGAARQRLLEAGRRLKDMPYHYICCAGWPQERVLGAMRRWLRRHVGLDENGKAKPCVFLYDWLKLADAGSLTKNVQEYQALGFQTTALKNFMSRYKAGCLTFAQANRQGLDDDDESVVAGSDRITWFATSLAIYRWLRPEERAGLVGRGRKLTHAMKRVLTRHGDKGDPDDNLLFETDYSHSLIKEGPTMRQAMSGSGAAQGPGFQVNGDGDDGTSVAFSA